MTTTTPKESGMEARVETVTPDVARQWLEHLSPRQRSLSKGWVEKLAQKMLDGVFELSPATVSFDEEGRLIDGYHRLTACVLSGCTIQLLVVRAAPERSFAVLDRGRTRASYQFHDGPHGSLIHGAARFLRQIEYHLTYNAGSNPRQSWLNLEMAEQLEYVESWPELAEWAPMANAISLRSAVVSVPGRYVLTVVCQAARTEWAPKIEDFLTGMRDGDLGGLSDPRTQLGRLFRGHRRPYLMSSQGADYAYSMVAKAWNLYSEGASVKMLKMTAGERRTAVRGSKAAVEAHKEPVLVNFKKKVAIEDDE